MTRRHIYTQSMSLGVCAKLAQKHTTLEFINQRNKMGANPQHARAHLKQHRLQQTGHHCTLLAQQNFAERQNCKSMARALNKHDNMPMAKKLALKMLAAPTVATSNMSTNVTQPVALKIMLAAPTGATSNMSANVSSSVACGQILRNDAKQANNQWRICNNKRAYLIWRVC